MVEVVVMETVAVAETAVAAEMGTVVVETAAMVGTETEVETAMVEITVVNRSKTSINTNIKINIRPSRTIRNRIKTNINTNTAMGNHNRTVKS